MKNSRVQVSPTHIVIQTRKQTQTHPKTAPIDWTCLAIIACFCCFWPLGIIALIFAHDATSATER
ncbi:Hypothetical predicted protein [Mytilus galloprovincialis]|uniref:Uncharacterized protein n=1 Tax=Mytilus galloprovincialis TaxID=29158 RepID=A0A8B6CEN6_MYTGA|nr:Hypothetical predicted protein [Mytilus galloprovincialis]